MAIPDIVVIRDPRKRVTWQLSVIFAFHIESDRIRVYVRVRPRTLEESNRQEEFGVEYNKFEVSKCSSKVEIDSVIKTPRVPSFFFFFTLIKLILFWYCISLLICHIRKQFSKGLSYFLELSYWNSIAYSPCFDCNYIVSRFMHWIIEQWNEHCILLTRVTNKLQADYLSILTWISETEISKSLFSLRFKSPLVYTVI